MVYVGGIYLDKREYNTGLCRRYILDRGNITWFYVGGIY